MAWTGVCATSGHTPVTQRGAPGELRELQNKDKQMPHCISPNANQQGGPAHTVGLRLVDWFQCPTPTAEVSGSNPRKGTNPTSISSEAEGFAHCPKAAQKRRIPPEI